MFVSLVLSSCPLPLEAYGPGKFCATPYIVENNITLARPSNQTFYDTTHFRIHYDTTGIAAVDTAYVRLIAGIAEYSWEIEVDSMGFDEPPPDTGGGDSRYDIYIQDLGGGFGYCAYESPGNDPEQEDYTSYTVIACYLDDYPGAPQGTVSHEFMHACQFSYTRYDGAWFMENCATWAMEMVYPDHNGYDNGLDGVSPLGRPNYRITYFGNSYQYSGVLWPLFLMFWTGDTSVVEACWDSMGLHWGYHTLEDIDGVLKRDYGQNLPNAMAEYAVWRWFTGSQWDDWHWSESYMWPEVRTLRIHDSYPAVGDEDTMEIYGPGGTNFVVFHSWGQADSLYFYFDGQDRWAWDARVIGYRSGHDVPSDIYEMDVNQQGGYQGGYGALAVPTLDYDSLILVPYCLNWPMETPGLTFVYSVNTVAVEESPGREQPLSGQLFRNRFIFRIPTDGWVRVSVYDVAGRLAFVKEGNFSAGDNSIAFGIKLTRGIYIWKLEFGNNALMSKTAIF